MADETLKRGILSFWGIVFLSVIAIFPGSIYIISSTTALTFAGEAAPLTFILGTVLMFFNVIAVYIFSTKVVNAGGFYKFVQKATNNSILSRSVAWVQFLAQMSPVIISATVFGWLISVTASSLFNITIPAFIPFVASILVILYVFLVSYFGIKLSARIAMIVGLAQIIFILIAGIYIVSHTPYNTVNTFNIGKSSGGLSGFFIGMVTGPLTAYIGYSAIVHFSEEAKFSKTTMKKAIITSIIIAGVFETFMMYAITVGTAPSNLSSLSGTYAPALVLTKEYMGLGFALLVLIVALIGQITSPLTFGNAAERIVYSLGRDGVFPKSFTKIHKKYGTPSTGAIFVFVFAILASIITQLSLVYYYGVLTGLFYTVVIWATILTVTNLIYHFVVNETLPILMRRLKELNILKNIVGPTIGSVFIIIIFYYTFLGIAYPFIYTVPIILIWIVIGVFVSYRKRKIPLSESDIGEATN
jgi:amino acid transporter